ncbi:MAG: response regulator [Calditrichaeota bacterium]|nr:response regulator [Calditrichota bacterium]
MTVPRILIVDDDEGFRNLLATMLSSENYKIESVESGQSALDIFPTFQPHIVLLDVIMPEMSGIDTLREIRKIDQAVKVVMVSGWHDLGVVKEAVELGASEFLTKPFDPMEFNDFIQRSFTELNY